MNPSLNSVDVRLFLPVLGAWLVLVGICNAPTELDRQTLALVAAAACAVLALFGTRYSSQLLIFGLSSCAFLISFLVQFGTDTIAGVMPDSGSWDAQLREQFNQASSVLPGAGGELVPGLAIGDTSRVSPSLSQAMKSVSLTHITAVSGANCVIVVSSVIYLSGLCGAGRKLRVGIAATSLLFFVILVTPQPSVVRAAVMATVVLLSHFLGRPSVGLPLLSVAISVLLLWNPLWATDFGFILSVVATAGLLLFSKPLTVKLSRWIPLWIAGVIAIPLSAQLMCQPFIILLTPYLPTYGLVANIVATPAAPLATVLGLCAVLSLNSVPALSSVLLWLAWLPAQWIAQTAISLSALPFAQIKWIEGLPGAVITAFCSLVILIALLSARAQIRRFALFVCLISLVVWTGFRMCESISFALSIPTNWVIAACDVGQGDAVFLRSEDTITLVDVGPDPRLLDECQVQLGVGNIDTLILTHYDRDHVGGVQAVLGEVKTAIVGIPEDLGDQQIVQSLSAAGAEVISGHAGMNGTSGNSIWRILWPDGNHPSMMKGNPGSLVLYVKYPEFNAMFLGDLGQEAQLAMMQSQNVEPVDVVKVAHHGSADQSESLYQLLTPQVGILSVGAGNEYDHPRQETLDILTKVNALAPRTDQDGLIVLSVQDSRLSVWTER